jgi:hypothetical protein
MDHGYRSMTVNERLFTAGVVDQFDEALRQADRVRLTELLTLVELGDQADQIISTILAHPERYLPTGLKR